MLVRQSGGYVSPQRLCEKRSSAFKVRKKNWLSRPKGTSFHTVSHINLRSKGGSCQSGKGQQAFPSLQHATAPFSTQPDRERYARSTAKESRTSSLRLRTLTSFRSHALESRCSTWCLNTSSSAKSEPATPARDRNVEISSMKCCLSSCKTQVCSSCCTLYCCIRVLLSRDAHPAREVDSTACSSTPSSLNHLKQPSSVASERNRSSAVTA